MYYKIKEEFLSNIAAAIREKLNLQKQLEIQEFSPLIRSIGGETIFEVEGQTTFLGWDGLQRYRQNATSPFPFSPTPNFLLVEKEVGDNFLRSKIYTTTSGKHLLFIKLLAAATITLNINASFVDWGDGTQSTTLSHTYSAAGAYTIKCDGTTLKANFISPNSILYEAHFAKGLTTIQQNAFSNQTYLQILTLPSSCTNIAAENVFDGCVGLNALVFPANCSITKLNAVKVQNIILPSTVSELPSSYNNSNPSLKQITLPEGIKEIPAASFLYNYGLEQIHLPSSLVSIGSNAFKGCANLQKLEIPQSTTTLSVDCFKDCTGLLSIELKSPTPPILQNGLVFDKSTCPIVVPKGTLATYKNATNWILLQDRLKEAAQ